MKKILELLTLTVVIVILFVLFLNLKETVLSPGPLSNFKESACFNYLEQNCFLVKVAKTDLEKQQGLMFQDKLEKNKGMLFIFEKEDIYPFWMKNTLIPLDIIWISQDKKVVFINENSWPCETAECPLINPNTEAKYVLEINAGISKNIGIKTGDSVEFYSSIK